MRASGSSCWSVSAVTTPAKPPPMMRTSKATLAHPERPPRRYARRTDLMNHEAFVRLRNPSCSSWSMWAAPVGGNPFADPKGLPTPMPPLFTNAFFDELVKRMNNDPDFRSKTANVSASVLMVNTDTKQSFLMQIQKGAASYQPGNTESKADFTFLGDSAIWASNHRGEASMEKLVMTGK